MNEKTLKTAENGTNDGAADAPRQLSDLIGPYALKGGKNAGKPRAVLPMDLIAELGPPPRNIAKRIEWYAYKLSLLDYGISLGHPWQQLAHTTRQNAMADLRLSGELIAAELIAIKRKEKALQAEKVSNAAQKNEVQAKDDQAARPKVMRIGAVHE